MLRYRLTLLAAAVALTTACDPGPGSGDGQDGGPGSEGGEGSAETDGSSDGPGPGTVGEDSTGTTGEGSTSQQTSSEDTASSSEDTASSSGDTAGDEQGTDTGGTCEVAELDPRRVLIETEQAVLADWSLSEVLAAIATNAGLDADPQGTHDQLFDTYRLGEIGEFDGRHCDDEQVDGVTTLNGFPLICPRSEGAFTIFDEALDGWFTTAVVNRVDLAPADGSHCGEQRIIFANPNMVGRAFIIIEAQIPNPAPACGVAACGAIAEAWSALDAIDDPNERSARLRAAFLTGDPELTAAGFSPFMSADNLTFGTGQLRTNNFVTGPWTLREFKLVSQVDGPQTVVRAEPVPVTSSPHDAIWDDLSGLAVGAACREAILDALPELLVDDVNTMGLSLPSQCLSSESVEFEDFYDQHLAFGTGTFAAAIDAEIQALDPGSSLDAFDVARRAQFSGSCIGCHEHSGGVDLGAGVIAPFSLSFVHVDEELTEPCGAGQCFAISPALHDDLLPHRLEVLETLLLDACEDDCATTDAVAPGRSMLPGSELGLAALMARDEAAQPRGLTLGGRPVGAGH